MDGFAFIKSSLIGASMLSNLLSRYDYLLYIALFLLVFGDGGLAQPSTKDDIRISMEAEFYHLRVYQSVEGHKALAVGPGGNWAWSKGAPSSKAAEDAALSSCAEALRASPQKNLSTRNCVLFDVDGKATGQAVPIGIPFGTVLETPDYPLGSGQIWNPSGQDRPGIMVMLHGCNRVNMGGWWIAWINYYRAAGFLVIVPDSFADPRDEEICGVPSESDIDKQTRILKLRIAQTRRTLRNIRKQFPGAPIYLHGHSEGGLVVQALGEDVAGIIVTGTSCGVGKSEAYWTAPDVPVLIIAGGEDKFNFGGRNATQLASYCKEVQGPGKLTAILVQGMGHLAAIWRPEVNDAIAKFLKIPAINISRKFASGVHFPPLSADHAAQYQQAKENKALATDERGRFHWEESFETPFDATEAALFGCDDYIGKDPFSSSDHIHSCVLVDVNGTKPIK